MDGERTHPFDQRVLLPGGVFGGFVDGYHAGGRQSAQVSSIPLVR